MLVILAFAVHRRFLLCTLRQTVCIEYILSVLRELHNESGGLYMKHMPLTLDAVTFVASGGFE